MQRGGAEDRVHLMLAFSDIFGCGNLSRVLIFALSLGFALGAPVDAVQPAGCALVGDCSLSPAEEPRESESLSLSLAGSSSEKLQHVVAITLKAALQTPTLIAAPRLNEWHDLRHLTGRENLPDKPGPPSA